MKTNPSYLYQYYDSPVGRLILISKENRLTGVLFEDPTVDLLKNNMIQETCSCIEQTKKWFDAYFRKEKPEMNIPIQFEGTQFQKMVWEALVNIPYGQTISYGDVAKEICRQTGQLKMSAQAVGQAVGRNPIAIYVPCHRVIGTNGKLVGYGGGLERKTYLLDLEQG